MSGFCPENSWKLRIPSQMSSIDGLYRDQKNLIRDFDSEESSLFSTALEMGFLCLHLIFTNLDISDLQHASFPDSIPVLERYSVVFEKSSLAGSSNLSQLSCSLLATGPWSSRTKEGIPYTITCDVHWCRRRNVVHS